MSKIFVCQDGFKNRALKHTSVTKSTNTGVVTIETWSFVDLPIQLNVDKVMDPYTFMRKYPRIHITKFPAYIDMRKDAKPIYLPDLFTRNMGQFSSTTGQLFVLRVGRKKIAYMIDPANLDGSNSGVGDTYIIKDVTNAKQLQTVDGIVDEANRIVSGSSNQPTQEELIEIANRVSSGQPIP